MLPPAADPPAESSGSSRALNCWWFSCSLPCHPCCPVLLGVGWLRLNGYFFALSGEDCSQEAVCKGDGVGGWHGGSPPHVFVAILECLPGIRRNERKNGSWWFGQGFYLTGPVAPLCQTCFVLTRVGPRCRCLKVERSCYVSSEIEIRMG